MTQPAPARGQRLPRAARRAQLLEAAQQVFVTMGYHQAAMDDIADQAGVSKPVLYQHFPGKLDLYLALLDQQCTTLEGLVNQALSAPTQDRRERVEATISAYFDFVASEDGAFRMVFESDLTSEPRVRATLDAVAANAAESIAATVAQDTGATEDVAFAVGIALAGMAQTSARHWFARDSGLSMDEAARVVSSLAWSGLAGLPPRPDTAPSAPALGSPATEGSAEPGR